VREGIDAIEKIVREGRRVKGQRGSCHEQLRFGDDR
jgi:hypothetical protein